MADIKTNLRELSVIVGTYKKINNLSYDEKIANFLQICGQALPNINVNQYANLQGITTLNSDQLAIINNGFSLANAIITKFDITQINEINWYGFDSQKEEPYDISINNIKFSLKEDSFILENMGLYKLVNCFTGTNYKKRHIFEDYAMCEYCNWFAITWGEMKNYLASHNNVWNYTNPKNNGKSAKIEGINNQIELTFIQNGSSTSVKLSKDCGLVTFEKNTSSKIREEVFAKFINQELGNNTIYEQAKKQCAVAATTALAKELTDNLNYTSGIARFLRIHSNEYYYAKTTNAGVEMYKVPSISNFTNTIQIESIKSSVPASQANILTTIKNTSTGKTLVLRNECRFSHGQFNGTPEAKMYYEHGGSLLTIYEE